VREFVSQPLQKTALVAPPVAAPQISPEVVARRNQEQQARGADPRRAGGPGNAGVAAQPIVPLPPSRVANTAPGRSGEPDRDRRGRDPREELRARASAQPTQIAPVQADPRIGATPAPHTAATPTAPNAPAPNTPVPHAAVAPPAANAPPHVTSTLPPTPATAPAVTPAPQVAHPSPRVVPPPPNRVNVGAPQAQNPREPPAPVAAPAPAVAPAVVPSQRPTATAVPPAEPRGRQRGDEQRERGPVGARAPQPDPNAAAAAQQRAQAARAEAQARAQAEQVRAHAEAQGRAQAQAQPQAQVKPPPAPEAHPKATPQEKQERRNKAVAEERDDPKRGEQRR
jgi:hypothetical protein